MFEQIGSIFSIIMSLTGLTVGLFHFVRKPQREWIYATAFQLCCLLSNYYWGIYVLVMNDDPNVSSFMAYLGWNLSYIPLVLLLIRRRKRLGEKKISPLAFLPIPLNFWQFTIYIQFGGLFNNIVQVGLTTAIACLSINAISIYLGKKEEENTEAPYIPFALLCFCFMEYVAWTASCFDWPSEWLNPYNYASLLSSVCYLLIPLALRKVHGSGRRNAQEGSYLHRSFRFIYFIFIMSCCVGGFALASWMRDTIAAGIDHVGDTDPYTVIAVMLFVVSIVIVLFSIMVILVVSFESKTEETRAFKEAKVSAERSNAAKSDFLANMSHEIRTPINAVLGMNEMIMNDALKARDLMTEDRQKVRKVFTDIVACSKNIDSAGKNLLSIINDILDFSKIEAGKMEIVEAQYRLSSVLNDVSNMISFKATAKGLSFMIDADGDLPELLYGDEIRVRQVVVNLLSNAVKYTRKGSVTLTVSEKKHDDDDKITDIIFSVKDTGIGILRRDQERLFSKFERMDIGKNSTVEGTGLGLAITKSLLDLMGGSIRVESDYGSGSVFTATIPQEVRSEEHLGDFRKKFAAKIEALESREETFYAPGAHILLVDDTQLNLMVVKGLLKDTGIVIDTAESGKEAIELAGNYPYDMILMDQRMPEMDGTTAMQKIRALRSGPNAETPFICLTADAVAGAKERYMEAGFQDYLTKPIGGQALEEVILNYLPEEKIRREARQDRGTDRETTEDDAAVTVQEADAPDTDPADEEESMIDRGAGLRFCGGKESFYKEILKEYLRDSKKKRADLTEYYKGKAWNNYEIVVHALKSSSKMIGAAGLAEIAAALEKAAKAGDEAPILKEHDGMMKLYASVIAILTEEFGEIPDSDDEEDDQEEWGDDLREEGSDRDPEGSGTGTSAVDQKSTGATKREDAVFLEFAPTGRKGV